MKNRNELKVLLLFLFVGCWTHCMAVPRDEYPRPQFERADWICLNGEWTCEFDFGHSGLERGWPSSQGFSKRIIVPFCPESELSGIGYKDFIEDFWYQRFIDIPASWGDRHVRLNFGAVYYEAEVFIDGHFATRHIGGTSSFSTDITSLVSPGNRHSLVVHVKSNLRSMLQAAGKQSLHYGSYSCDYTRTTGIWQSVWMEPVAAEGLVDVQMQPDIDQKQIVIRPRFFSENGGWLQVAVKEGNRVVARQKVKASNSSMVVLPLKNMKTWSPEEPFLYDVELTVTNRDGQPIDQVKSYVGVRKVHFEGNRIYLNNQPFYQRLVLDQGFYPDGIWTAPSDEALRHDIELSMQAGFNGARLHQKVFEERFHYWADRLGYLTWGEASSWGMDCNEVETARNFLAEWGEIVARDRNHPSIITWTPLNEEWNPDRREYPRLVENLYALTKQLDPTRPFHDSSGGVHAKTDIWTAHTYEQDPDKLRDQIINGGRMMETPRGIIDNYRGNFGFNGAAYTSAYTFPDYHHDMPYLIDEFGGIKWNPSQQLSGSQTESWGYGEPPRSLEEFYTRLEHQVEVLLSLSEQVWGYCYTQLTDVEQEQNGIYYYDRKSKFDMKRINAIFSKTPKTAK